MLLCWIFANQVTLIPSNAASSLSACYKKHDNIKKRAYNQLIREIECVSFTPVVMLGIGGVAHVITSFYKHLTSLLSHKWVMNIQ